MSIFTSSFTLQDILGATLAFCLFPLVIVFPGYVMGWVLDLFDFRLRQPIVRLGIGLVLSFAVSPIVLDLISSLLSLNVSLLTLGGFATAFVVILLKEKTSFTSWINRDTKIICWIGAIWIALAIFSLIDIQWKDQLYFSVISYDQSSRVSVIDAMARTGVPPINPSYYPGHPVQLTFLYYFWYILGSLIDVIGGRFVDARAALTASSAWAGLGLMATVALYLRQRNANKTGAVWRSARIGIGLLAVGGLDSIPFILLVLTHRMFSDINHWNAQIMAWIGSALWVPHHLASLLAGLTAMMLVQSTREKNIKQKYIAMTIAGMAFASTMGLSVWVTLVFAVFWVGWIIMIFLKNKERELVIPMIYAGAVALILVSPFLAGILQGGTGGTGQSPIAFEIRKFYLLDPFDESWSPVVRSLARLALLPVNYLFQLGFFFIAGLLWFEVHNKEARRSKLFFQEEALLLGVVLFFVTFLRSTTVAGANDLGWRAWLPGEFVLLVWGVDVMEMLFFNNSSTAPASIKTRNFLRALITIGILTSVMDTIFLRAYWPAWSGIDLGQRSYSARLVYDFVRDHVPADAITQNNPLNAIDRPSGLYGTHQMVIADRTAYGIPSNVFYKLVNGIGILFTNGNAADWKLTDQICQQYSIDVLIIKDADPIWSSLAALEMQRPALYKNNHYAVFACGNYAQVNR